MGGKGAGRKGGGSAGGGKGAKGGGKGGGKAAGEKGGAALGPAKDPVADAIREIKEQLRVQGGTGKVHIEGWRERFGDALGGIRAFVESRPDKFEIQPTKKGLVITELAASRKRRQEEAVEEEEAAAPPAKRRRGEGGQAVAAAAEVAPDAALLDLTSLAIKEIKESVAAQGGAGRVHVENWQDRFGPELGPLKAFVKSRPDKFSVLPGKALAVEIVGGKASGVRAAAVPTGKASGKGKAAGKGKAPVDESAYIGGAIFEIRQQVREQGGVGQVYVEDWMGRYGHVLGGLRQFIESRPDKFTVFPEGGKRFTVAEVQSGKGGAGWGSGGKGGMMALTNGGASGKGKGKGKDRGMAVQYDADTVNVAALAIKEIKELVRERGGTARVQIEGWNERFAPVLGSLKAFVCSRPDKFDVHSTKKGVVLSVAGTVPEGMGKGVVKGKGKGKGKGKIGGKSGGKGAAQKAGLRPQVAGGKLWTGAIRSVRKGVEQEAQGGGKRARNAARRAARKQAAAE